jgi:hypothetical protein
MWKKVALGVLLLGTLCVAAGLAVVVAQTSFGASRDSVRHVALTGDDGGSGMPFRCACLGDEGGSPLPFVKGNVS